MPRAFRVGRALSLAGAMVLFTTPAQAQFGKLKKIGADAIKDAAKDKLGTDKKPATTSSPAAGATAATRKEAATPVFTEDKVALLVISLGPQIKEAQRRDEVARANAAWVPKKKASDECIQNASKNINPMTIAATAQRNEAKLTALQKQAEGVNARLGKAMEGGNIRSQLFLQDSSQVLTMRMAVLSYGVGCQVDFTPPAIIEYNVAERIRMTQAAASGAESSEGFDPGAAVTGVMSNYEYGLLRERMALWALLQDDPTLKGVGKQGTFTAEETAALTAHAADIKKMLPLFKSDALIWKSWSDLKSW